MKKIPKSSSLNMRAMKYKALTERNRAFTVNDHDLVLLDAFLPQLNGS